jgi:hypothetical protein
VVTGVDDAVADGTTTTLVTIGVDRANSDIFYTVPARTVVVTNADNEPSVPTLTGPAATTALALVVPVVVFGAIRLVVVAAAVFGLFRYVCAQHQRIFRNQCQGELPRFRMGQVLCRSQHLKTPGPGLEERAVSRPRRLKIGLNDLRRIVLHSRLFAETVECR